MIDAMTIGRKRPAAFALTAALLAAASALAMAASTTPASADQRDKWCKGVHLRFFVGGAEGDAFGTIVYNGAKQAEHDLGPTVDYIFSGWDPEKMVQQLREAVAVKPDGIAMMGHPGDAAIMPLAEEASKAGIKMMYQNVPVPQVVAKFGGGYVGAQQARAGPCARRRGGQARRSEVGRRRARARRPFDEENRGATGARHRQGDGGGRRQGHQDQLARPNGPPTRTWPSRSSPPRSRRTPSSKAIGYPGGQQLGNVPAYMQAAGKKPGEIFNFGFDTSPQIVEGLQGRLGAAHRGPAAVPAGLPADPEPLRARSSTASRRSTSTPAPVS